MICVVLNNNLFLILINSACVIDAVDASYDVGHVYSFVYNVTHMTVSSAI